MVDRGRAQDLNEAAKRFAETLADSYRLVYGQAAQSAERQQQRAQEFSELVSSSLREQTEAGRANAQQLSEQAERQREAYAEFLDSVFSGYRAGTEQATQSAQAACAPSLNDRYFCHCYRGGRLQARSLAGGWRCVFEGYTRDEVADLGRLEDLSLSSAAGSRLRELNGSANAPRTDDAR